MSETKPITSRFRKNFLVIGIVLLILGFYFFYEASRVNWDYVTTHNSDVNLALPTFSNPSSQVGYASSYGYDLWDFYVQPNDDLTVGYPESIQINGTIQIVLYGFSGQTETQLTSSYTNVLGFTDQLSYPLLHVQAVLIAQNRQNITVSTTTEVHHYETPQWIYFGAGVVLSLLAVIPIFKSKK